MKTPSATDRNFIIFISFAPRAPSARALEKVELSWLGDGRRASKPINLNQDVKPVAACSPEWE